ncbi:50S ribosomal protein L4 [Candidatus Uhrbacteria bacterium]|nr:50S ribosomal protein L4 [Candidatus Uhrbacteria bacterium]
MPKVKIYNQEGKVTGDLELNASRFGVTVDPALVHEVSVAQAANARQSIAHTKTKGEVRGGGKKPWKQKGTGRARQGSTRNPQWVGGGVAFGPRFDRNFSVKVNRRVKQKALFMALTDKVNEEKFLVLEAFQPQAIKTKVAAQLFKKLPVARRTLAVVSGSEPELLRMIRNLPDVQLTTVNSLNLNDVLHARQVVFWKDAVEAFENVYRNA